MRLRLLVPLFALFRIIPTSASRMIYPFLSVFAAGLGISIQQISIAVSLRAFAGLFGPLFTSLSDHFGHKTGMLVGAGIFALGNLSVVFFPNFITFCFFLMGGFVGMLVMVAAMQSYLSDRVPYERRGMVMGLLEVSWAASFFLGMPLIGLFIDRYGWHAPFPVFGTLGVIMVVAMAILVPGISSERKGTNALSGFWISFRQILTVPRALLLLLMSFLFVMGNEIVSLMFGVWLQDSYGLQIAALGAASAVIGASELIAELLSSGLTDRLGKQRLVGIGLASNAFFVLLMPYLGRFGAPGAFVGLFFFFFSFELAMVSLISVVTEMVPTSRATFLGATFAAFSLGRMLGALAAPNIYLGGGFMVSCTVAMALDILAIALLTQVKVGADIAA